MVALQPIFKKAYWSLVIFGGIYVTCVYLATYPAVNRALLYMNWVNPTFFQDVNDVEAFGFLPHQVQPFSVVTSDNETLYAWHILPASLTHQHSALLREKGTWGPAADYSATGAFQLLRDDPDARVVVNLHGNAAHLGSGYRPPTYMAFLAASTPTHPVHVIAFDYRGFGLSTGSPTEEGLITDAEAVLTYLTGQLGISRSRIAIVGHSLGTAVAAGVAERMLISEGGGDEKSSRGRAELEEDSFAGVLLFSGFSDLPTLVKTYSLGGLFPPFLSPLVQYPTAQKYVLNSLADKWMTGERCARLAGMGDSSTDPANFDLTIIHAKNDKDVWWGNGWKIFLTATRLAERNGMLVAANATQSRGDDGRNGGTIVTDQESADKKSRYILWERKGG
ncbi:hypothetical protein KEM52_005891, partial [Ascosphaera acerosa]